MTIGVSGPIDLKLLDWEYRNADLPQTNSFPLTSHFINALLKRGYKVIGYTSSGEVTEPQVLTSGNLTICICQHKPQPGRRFFLFEVEELRKIILAHPADMISAFWSYEYAWAALKTGIPTVVSLHDVAFEILKTLPDMFRMVRWMINYIVVHKATHIIANSAYTYNLLDKRTQRKAVTINNFYAQDLESSLQPRAQKGDYIISVVQGFTKRKNIKTALHAFARLREKFPTLEYRLLGVDMEEGGQAQQYARQHNLEAGVRFVGPLPFNQVYDHIAEAKVLFHPSIEESFGMVLLEAMVAGTAVAGGKNSGFVPHLLNYGKAGLLFDPTSPADMAEKLGKILGDKSLREELIRNAHFYAKVNFSEDVIIEKHLDYYSKVFGRELTPTGDVENTRTHMNYKQHLPV